MELKGDKILRYKQIQNGKLPEFELGTPGFAQENAVGYPSFMDPAGLLRILPTEANFADKTSFTTVPKEGLTYIQKNGPLDTSYKGQDNSENVDKLGTVLNGAGKFVGEIEKSFDAKSEEDIYNTAISENRTRSGIGYTYKRLPGAKNGKLPHYSRGTFDSMLSTGAAGAQIGSAFGPWGTAIGGIAGGITGLVGGIISGNKEARNRENVLNRLGLENQDAAYTADGIAMRLNGATEYGDTRNGRVRGFKCGKLPGYSNGVRSAFGLINGMPANARTDGDELIIDTITGAVAQNPSSKHTDSYNSYIRPQDMIIPGKQSKGLLKALGFKNGRLPGFANGRWDNIGTSLASGVAGLSQYLQAMNDTPYKPNTYASNPYEKKALNDLYGLRANVYPILPSIYDAQAKGMYAIANSGGLSGGQRTLARLAATSGTQQNIANMLLNAQNQNNQYLAQAANASLTAGNNAAQRRMQANQFDLDYFSKVHAARQQGMQMGLYNMVNSLQNYYKNKNKWDMFAMSHKLYSDELEAKKKGLIS